jgi:hypothetical protein
MIKSRVSHPPMSVLRYENYQWKLLTRNVCSVNVVSIDLNIQGIGGWLAPTAVLALQSIPWDSPVGGTEPANVLYILITILQHTTSTTSVFTSLSTSLGPKYHDQMLVLRCSQLLGHPVTRRTKNKKMTRRTLLGQRCRCSAEKDHLFWDLRSGVIDYESMRKHWPTCLSSVASRFHAAFRPRPCRNEVTDPVDQQLRQPICPTEFLRTWNWRRTANRSDHSREDFRAFVRLLLHKRGDARAGDSSWRRVCFWTT